MSDVRDIFEQTCQELIRRSATAYDQNALVGLRNESFNGSEGINLTGASGNGGVFIELINGWVPQLHTLWYNAFATGSTLPALHQLRVEMRSPTRVQHAAGGFSQPNTLALQESNGVNNIRSFVLAWNEAHLLSGGEGGLGFQIVFITAGLGATAIPAYGVSWSYRRVLPASKAPGTF